MQHICEENKDKILIEYRDKAKYPNITGFYMHHERIYYCPFCGFKLSNIIIKFETMYDKQYDILYIDSSETVPFGTTYKGIGSNIYESISADTNSVIGYMLYNYKIQDINKLKEVLPEHIHKYLKRV